MTRAALVCACVLLNGCALFTAGTDRVMARMVKEAKSYCENAYHRRLALYTLVNGELEPHSIHVGVTCPGDPDE